jgi:hypothetical protein
MDGNEQQSQWSDADTLPEHVPYPRSVVVAVSVLLVGIGILSAWYMVSSVRLDIPAFGSGNSLKEISRSLLDQEDNQLRLQDSDEDGLSDYDELNVYATSAFVADTDSDGIIDAEEVRRGTDPNCPQGRTCSDATNPDSSRITGGIIDSPYATEDVKGLLQDPAALRTLLIAAGADVELVSKLDDQTIQILAQQSLSDITGVTPEKIDVLKGLTIVQIRDILRSFGMTEEDVTALTDEEVTTIYQDALKEFENTPPQL